MNNTTISLLLLLSLLIPPSSAHDAPQDFLWAHNKVRAAHAVAPLEWNSNLEDLAHMWASKLAEEGCVMKHSDGYYGENLASCNQDMTATRAVEVWAEEEKDFDYNNACCVPGKMCGHYTQMVWRETLEVGCAKVRCPAGEGTIISCEYEPPGNYVGEKPY